MIDRGARSRAAYGQTPAKFLNLGIRNGIFISSPAGTTVNLYFLLFREEMNIDAQEIPSSASLLVR